MDAICISDLHLGSDVCQAKLLESFLKRIRHEEIITNELITNELILNGDVFDSWDFRCLPKRHWNVLSQIRKLSNQVRVVWVSGNHDGPADLISHLIGVDVVDEYILESGGKKILFIHGDKFDKFLDDHPILTKIGDFIYGLLQKIDNSHYLARLVKHSSKTYLRCTENIKKESIKYARKRGCDLVCCGHSHFSTMEQPYYNSGCWTELPCHFLSISNGGIELHEIGEQ